MIDVAYCREMARYNAWQNRQVKGFVDRMSQAEVAADRGAFFGSILGTLNHLLWGDLIWMSRFDGGAGPDVPGPESPSLHPTIADWGAARFRTDARIQRWADGVSNVDLQGSLRWYSGVLGSEVSKPLALCIVGFFNHQTHHRGQVHAMLTAAGSDAPVSDLFLMPEDG